MKPDLKF